jgi:hypothetical protein
MKGSALIEHARLMYAGINRGKILIAELLVVMLSPSSEQI